MDFREFLETFLTMEDLSGLLFLLEIPRNGTKDVLISRIVEAEGKSPITVLVLVNNKTLQNALRRSDLPTTGRKSELVLRLIENVVVLTQDDVLAFLESLDKGEFDAYHELLLHFKAPIQVERVARLLGKASGRHLRAFAKVFRTSSNPARAARSLVSTLSRGSGDAPCFAACVLEGMIDAAGSVVVVSAEVERASDEIMARQGRIRRSFARQPGLAHPAVDSILQKSWSGEFAQRAGLVKDVREEVRTVTRTIGSAVKSLREPAQAETLNEVSKRTMSIDTRTEAIRRGVETLQDQLREVHDAVQKHVQESPDEVAAALEKLSKAKDVKWGTKRRMKRDLQRFWTLTDRLQKIEFLGQAIATYGPAVLGPERAVVTRRT